MCILIICFVLVCVLCALWPNDVECVTGRPVPLRSVSLPVLDPRAGRGGGACGSPLRCAAGALLLGARGEYVRVRAGPPRKDVCRFVFAIILFFLVVRLVDGWGSACFSFFCVRCLLRPSHSRALTSRWGLAVGSRWGCILCVRVIYLWTERPTVRLLSVPAVWFSLWRWTTFFIWSLIQAFWHFFCVCFLCAARMSIFLRCCFFLFVPFSRPTPGWGAVLTGRSPRCLSCFVRGGVFLLNPLGTRTQGWQKTAMSVWGDRELDTG
ncbi:hypothetical protein ECC02_008363 [Trypanosoma cruzi]|uniref:Uncharacterized protein n=1 Tax=Trypanosoma cruzi TaxID=5693 RepID=A0A7J6XX30_TRYCR|nr:hypothetical protein ECC02_008363 [Trypanosoma cruzi]